MACASPLERVPGSVFVLLARVLRGVWEMMFYPVPAYEGGEAGLWTLVGGLVGVLGLAGVGGCAVGWGVLAAWGLVWVETQIAFGIEGRRVSFLFGFGEWGADGSVEEGCGGREEKDCCFRTSTGIEADTNLGAQNCGTRARAEGTSHPTPTHPTP